MKKATSLLLILALVLASLSLGGCGKAEQGPDYAIDYGQSQIFTRKELEKAVPLIQEVLDTWDGCRIHSLRYAGDEACTEENLSWLNELAEAQGKEMEFTRCACFLCDFRSPADESKAGAWNPDYEYTDWSWWLGCTAKGEWALLTWGY